MSDCNDCHKPRPASPSPLRVECRVESHVDKPVTDEDTLSLLRASAEQLCESIMRKMITPHIHWGINYER